MSEKREVGRPWAFPDTREWGVQFIKDWINGMIEGTREIKDDEVRQKVFWYPAAGCGKTWVPHLVEEHAYSGMEGDLDSLIAAADAHFKERSDPGHGIGCIKEGNVITVTMGSLKKELHPRYPAVQDAVRRYGDVCSCPLVINGIIPLIPDLCSCSQQMFNYTFESATGKRCTTEIAEAIARGGKNCVMRTTILDEPLDEKKKNYIEKRRSKK